MKYVDPYLESVSALEVFARADNFTVVRNESRRALVSCNPARTKFFSATLKKAGASAHGLALWLFRSTARASKQLTHYTSFRQLNPTWQTKSQILRTATLPLLTMIASPQNREASRDNAPPTLLPPTTMTTTTTSLAAREERSKSSSSRTSRVVTLPSPRERLAS